MAACELEDGELLDSDTEHEPSSDIQAVKSASTVSSYRNPVNYREKPDVKITSSSDESDEEEFTWKKKRYNVSSEAQQWKSTGYSFSNCLSSKDCTLKTTNPQFTFGQNNRASVTSGKPNRNKNVWGSVLQSQMLSQGFQGFDMEHKEDCYDDRQVESYNFKKALDDDRPWPVEADVGSEMTDTVKKSEGLFDTVPDLEKLEENFNGVYKKAEKRRRSAKKRLGMKPNKKTCKTLNVTADDDEEKVIEDIANVLEESKVYLVEKVVQVLGKKKALEMADRTKDVEVQGGMMTNDGGRRRTPGGVFFQLLKTDPQISKQDMKDIFNDERKEKAKSKKILRAKRFKSRLKKRMESEMGANENANMETAEGDRNEEKLDAVASDNTNSNSKDSFSQSNSSELSNDPNNMDMSDLLKQHKEYQSERQTAPPGSSSVVEKTDKGSVKDQPPTSSSAGAGRQEKRPDAVIYLDADVDMMFDN